MMADSETNVVKSALIDAQLVLKGRWLTKVGPCSRPKYRFCLLDPLVI